MVLSVIPGSKTHWLLQNVPQVHSPMWHLAFQEAWLVWPHGEVGGAQCCGRLSSHLLGSLLTPGPPHLSSSSLCDLRSLLPSCGRPPQDDLLAVLRAAVAPDPPSGKAHKAGSLQISLPKGASVTSMFDTAPPSLCTCSSALPESET